MTEKVSIYHEHNSLNNELFNAWHTGNVYWPQTYFGIVVCSAERMLHSNIQFSSLSDTRLSIDQREYIKDILTSLHRKFEIKHAPADRSYGHEKPIADERLDELFRMFHLVTITSVSQYMADIEGSVSVPLRFVYDLPKADQHVVQSELAKRIDTFLEKKKADQSVKYLRQSLKSAKRSILSKEGKQFALEFRNLISQPSIEFVYPLVKATSLAISSLNLPEDRESIATSSMIQNLVDFDISLLSAHLKK